VIGSGVKSVQTADSVSAATVSITDEGASDAVWQLANGINATRSRGASISHFDRFFIVLFPDIFLRKPGFSLGNHALHFADLVISGPKPEEERDYEQTADYADL